MQFKFIPSQSKLTTRLLFLNILICLAFATILLLVLVSFFRLGNGLQTLVDKDLSVIVNSSQISRKLSSLFAALDNVAAGQFLGKPELIAKSKLLTKRLAELSESDSLAGSRNALRQLENTFMQYIEGALAFQSSLEKQKTLLTQCSASLQLLEQQLAQSNPGTEGLALLASQARKHLTAIMLQEIGFQAPANPSAPADPTMALPPEHAKLLVVLHQLDKVITSRPELDARIRECRELFHAVLQLQPELAEEYSIQLNKRDAIANTISWVYSTLEVRDKHLSTTIIQHNKDAAQTAYKTIGAALLLAILVSLSVSRFSVFLVRSGIKHPMDALRQGFAALGKGQFDTVALPEGSEEWRLIGLHFRRLVRRLKDQNWLRSTRERLDDGLRGDWDSDEAAQRLINILTSCLDGQLGAIYLLNEENILCLSAGYALESRPNAYENYALGEGAVGQAGLDMELRVMKGQITELPAIHHPGGQTPLHEYLIAPIAFAGRLLGVIVVGKTSTYSRLELQFIRLTLETIGVSLHAAISRSRIRELLEKTRQQATDLQIRQNQLSQTNIELEQQAEALRDKEESLQMQKSALRVANKELAQQTDALKQSEAILKQQQEELQQANHDLTILTNRLEDQVAERTKKLEDEAVKLESANRRLRDLDKMKTMFVSSVSHELRTPLTSILGFAKLINRDLGKTFWPCADGNKTLERMRTRIEDNLDIIIHEGDRLSRLINDVLDLNKIESGRMQWRDIELEPTELIRQAVRALSADFRIKQDVDLLTDIPDSLPVIRIDPDRLSQVLINFLSNAAKFTDKGSVTVRAFPTSDGKMRIQVQDTGMGIPKGDLNKIFEKFHQVAYENILHEKPKGTGLGLTICKEIIEHYNGRIWAESVPEKGSTFIVELPAVPGKSVAAVSPICRSQKFKSATDSASNKGSEPLSAKGKDANRNVPVSAVGGKKD